jgi:hypothetical protein
MIKLPQISLRYAVPPPGQAAMTPALADIYQPVTAANQLKTA